MNGNLNTILNAALQLPAEEQQELIKKLQANGQQKPKEKGKIRKHFGIFDSGNKRSADNRQIDEDLARVYADNHEREN